jgi:hypothetical protein
VVRVGDDFKQIAAVSKPQLARSAEIGVAACKGKSGGAGADCQTVGVLHFDRGNIGLDACLSDWLTSVGVGCDENLETGLVKFSVSFRRAVGGNCRTDRSSLRWGVCGQPIRVESMTGDQSRLLKVGDRVRWKASATDLGTVVRTNWSGATIDWDDGHTASIQHNDMAQVERVPNNLV